MHEEKHRSDDDAQWSKGKAQEASRYKEWFEVENQWLDLKINDFGKWLRHSKANEIQRVAKKIQGNKKERLTGNSRSLPYFQGRRRMKILNYISAALRRDICLLGFHKGARLTTLIHYVQWGNASN